MANPDPDTSLINAIQAAKTAYAIHGILVDGGITCAIDAIQFICGVVKGYQDQADLIEFCCRHGGVTMKNAQRFLPSFMGQQRTNRCSNCHRMGHNVNHCPW
mmetsp:Transcript_32467/g.38065  ORF Transcript_32467/g.38065 Transcript_32467/m.38065 type:complete len:102 (-) Transcript_32467:280-585(-)